MSAKTDLIAIADATDAVGDPDHDAPRENLGEAALDRLLGRGVDPRKRVVENQDIRSEEPAWRHCSTR